MIPSGLPKALHAGTIVATLCAATSLLAQPMPADLDTWVARDMKEFEVPGLAVAVVKNAKVLVAKGYGVRKLGAAARVDEHTLFGIASNTKAFTAAAIATLVDEGKLSWDDPVQKYLPSFQLYDPYVTRELTVRDLLCHRSGLGLGEGDMLFWPDTDVTRPQVLSATRFMKPASSLRSRYAYNNLMFVVAGEVVAAVSGKPWDQYVRERFFAPLGMRETRITSAGLEDGRDNFAWPHSRGWRFEGPLMVIPPTRDDTWAAAAGIRSNVTDLAKWVTTQLDAGKLPDGNRIFSEDAAKEMWSPQTIVRVSEPAAPLKALKPNFAAYGLGWGLRDYRGRKVVSHTGALTGMVSTIMMVPDEKLGIIVLTNQEEGGAYSAIAYHLIDHFLNFPQTDWIAAFKASTAETRAKANTAEQKEAEARAKDTKPSLPLEKYAGEMVDAWYGKAILSLENGKLILHMSRTPSMVADLDHWQYDTFKAIWRDKTVADAFVSFALDRTGAVETMKMAPVSTLADFSFDYGDLLFRPVPKAKKK